MTVSTIDHPGRTGGYGFVQSARAEAIKITSLRSTLWIGLITAAGTALVTFLSVHNALHRGSDFYQGFDPTNQALAGVLIGILTIGVFGVLVVTGEYASGTIRSSLSATPRRTLFLAAKLAVAGLWMLVTAEVLSVAAFAFGQLVLSGGGAPHANLGQAGVARAVLETGLFLGLLGILAMGLGFVVRSTAGALSAYVGVTFLLPLLLRPLSEHIQRYMPVQILGNSVAVTVRNPDQLSPTMGILLMVAYTAVAVVAGAAVFARRDA